MWKYIIIAAVVLFLGACFLFYKNNEALAGPEGEVAAFQSQFDMAKKKAVDIEKDKAIKKYAEMRTAYFKQQTVKNNEERDALEAEDAPYEPEITKANAELEAAKADLKKYEDQFKVFRRGAAESAGLEGVDDEDAIRLVGQRMAEMESDNNALRDQVTTVTGEIDALKVDIDNTQKMIDAAKKLAADRKARLSPPELKCAVMHVDKTWDYVVLDAGIDKGIVIGSRLAVMRGETRICDLIVSLVESNRTSCEVVYSTMLPGEAVQPGDVVVSTNK